MFFGGVGWGGVGAGEGLAESVYCWCNGGSVVLGWFFGDIFFGGLGVGGRVRDWQRVFITWSTGWTVNCVRRNFITLSLR